MVDYGGRRARALREVGEVDALVLTNQEGSDAVSIRYASGFTGEGALVLAADRSLLLTDSRYTEQASREAPDLEVVETRAWSTGELAQRLEEEGWRRVAFAAARVSYHWVETMQSRFGGELVSVKDPVAALRLQKESSEVAALRTAGACADAALKALLEELRPGMNEVDAALRLEFLIRQGGADGIAFEINVSAGENTALNHYRPTLGRRTIAPGDLVLFDFGACVDGYRSDMTRTVCVGPASPRSREIYAHVLEANRLGIEAARAGASGVEVDRVARDAIAAAGYGEFFGHGLGHGIGLEVHERPTLSPRSEDTLAPGMVVTVEPGIYLPGYGGVRIEDDVLITKDGHEILTEFPKASLMEVGT
jgi:Xaa-Pro aminopeptidase